MEGDGLCPHLAVRQRVAECFCEGPAAWRVQMASGILLSERSARELGRRAQGHLGENACDRAFKV